MKTKNTSSFVVSAYAGNIKPLGTSAFGGMLDFTVPTRANSPVHHDLNCDVSYSTQNCNGRIIKEVQAYVDNLPDHDWVTVQRFSGEGDAVVVIGPIQVKNNRETIKEKVQKGLRLIGNTVFEESFELARQVINDLRAQGIFHMVVTFTDGEPVPSRRSIEAEKQASYQSVKRLGLQGATTSFVGFGIYYDEKFMLALRDHNGGGGLYGHINYIDDIRAFYQDVREVAWATEPGQFTDVKIFADGKEVKGGVLRTTPSVSNVANESGINFDGLYKGRTRLCFETPSDVKKIKVIGKFNGESFEQEVEPTKLAGDQVNEFVVTFASYAFAKGNRDEAIKGFEAVGANELLAEVENALSKSDRLAAASKLLSVPRKNPRLGIGAGLSATRKCHANFMIALSAGGDVLWHLKHDEDPLEGGYERHGKKSHTTNFRRNPDSTTVRITGFNSAEDRMNLNFTGKISGWWVTEDGKLTPGETDRTYGIIVDGALHTPIMKLTIPEKVFNALKDAEFIPADEKFDPNKIHRFDLRRDENNVPIPTVLNRGWSPVTLNLAGRLQDDVLMTLLIKKLKERKSATKAAAEATGYYGKPKGEKVVEEAKDTYYAPGRTYKLKTFGESDAESWYNSGKPIAGYTKAQVDKMDFEQAETAHSIVWNRRGSGRYLVSCIQIGVEGQGFERYFKNGNVVTRKGAADRHVSTLEMSGQTIERRAWDMKCEWS